METRPLKPQIGFAVLTGAARVSLPKRGHLSLSPAFAGHSQLLEHKWLVFNYTFGIGTEKNNPTSALRALLLKKE